MDITAIRYDSDGDGLFVAVRYDGCWLVYTEANIVVEMGKALHADLSRPVAYLRGEVNATGEKIGGSS